eukprot:5894919-Pyramimonas_sp.AAC.1
MPWRQAGRSLFVVVVVFALSPFRPRSIASLATGPPPPPPQLRNRVLRGLWFCPHSVPRPPT